MPLYFHFSSILESGYNTGKIKYVLGSISTFLHKFSIWIPSFLTMLFVSTTAPKFVGPAIYISMRNNTSYKEQNVSVPEPNRPEH